MIQTHQGTMLACDSKQRSVLRFSIHPCQGNRVAIGHTVVCYARAAHAFSAGIKCRHCIDIILGPLRIKIYEMTHVVFEGTKK